MFGLLSAIAVFIPNNAVAQIVPEDKTTVAQRTNHPSEQIRRWRSPLFSGQQVREEAVVPAGNNETIVEIEVVFVDEDNNLIEGKTDPDIRYNYPIVGAATWRHLRPKTSQRGFAGSFGSQDC